MESQADTSSPSREDSLLAKSSKLANDDVIAQLQSRLKKLGEKVGLLSARSDRHDDAIKEQELKEKRAKTFRLTLAEVREQVAELRKRRTGPAQRRDEAAELIGTVDDLPEDEDEDYEYLPENLEAEVTDVLWILFFVCTASSWQ